MAFGLSAAALSSIATVGGAVIGANASRSAARTQAAAADRANETQLQMYNQNREDQAPYRQGGYSALSALMNGMGLQPAPDTPAQSGVYGDAVPQGYQQVRDMLAPQYTTGGGGAMNENGDVSQTVDEQGLDAAVRAQLNQQQPTTQATAGGAPQGQQAGYGDLNRYFTLADFERDPGYQFRMDEGQRGGEASAAARGGLMSGGALKALERYRQGFASNEFNTAYNRFNTDRTNRFNRLSSIAGIGQTANNQVGGAGMNAANNISNNQLAAGNSQAAGQVGSANAISGGLQSLGNFWQQQNMMRPAGGSPSGSPSGSPGGSALDNFWTSGSSGD